MSARERGLLYFVIHYPSHFSLLEEKGAQKMLVAHPALEPCGKRRTGPIRKTFWPLLTTEEKRFWVECLDQKPRHDKSEQEELADILQLLDDTTVEGEGARIMDSIREKEERRRPRWGSGFSSEATGDPREEEWGTSKKFNRLKHLSPRAR